MICAMIFFDRSLNHPKKPWAGLGSKADSACSVRGRFLVISPWRAPTNDGPSRKQERYSREPEPFTRSKFPTAVSVPFVRSKSLND